MEEKFCFDSTLTLTYSITPDILDLIENLLVGIELTQVIFTFTQIL